jgi:hypothetical protein
LNGWKPQKAELFSFKNFPPASEASRGIYQKWA